jgi:sulfoxide reductase heme-binding subunit YedZ
MLHRLIWASVAAGVAHYWWLVKSDIRKPLMYGVIAALLLGYRVWRLLPPKRLLPHKA